MGADHCKRRGRGGCRLRSILILSNPNSTDDRASAKYLLDCGADYHSSTTGRGVKSNPGVGLGKFKYVATAPRSFAMTTLTQAQLEANPFQLTLTETTLDVAHLTKK
jgi:hypothetical protein